MRRAGYERMTQANMITTSHVTLQIQFSAKMLDGKHTDSSAVISLNAAGIRGCARLKCGSVIHDVRNCVRQSVV